MRESRRSEKAEMQKRMERESQNYRRIGSLFRQDANVKFFKCKEGQNLMDIMMYRSGEYDPIEAKSLAHTLRIYIHRGVAQDGSDIICIEQTFRDQKRREEIFGKGCFCPVCREHRRRAAANAPKEELDKLRYANWPRTIYNVYDRRNPGEGNQIFETSAYLLQQYLDVISKKAVLPGETYSIENYVPYMDIVDGKSISFDRQGMDEKTKFIGIAFEDRRTPIPDDIADSVIALDELIAWPTVASAYEAFWGVPLDVKDYSPVKGLKTDGPEVQDRAAKYKEEKHKEEKELPPEMTEEEKEEAELKAKMAELEEKKKKKAAEAALQAKVEPKENKKTSVARSGSCPGNGTFGKDIDELPTCEKCEVWKECAKENDRLERESR